MLQLHPKAHTQQEYILGKKMDGGWVGGDWLFAGIICGIFNGPKIVEAGGHPWPSSGKDTEAIRNAPLFTFAAKESV